MGKIFGISDNPVSTIESALKGVHHVEPPFPQTINAGKSPAIDKFVHSSKEIVAKPKMNPKNLVRKMLSFFKNRLVICSRGRLVAIIQVSRKGECLPTKG